MPATTSTKISSVLASGAPIVLDGALATYLETLGADITGSLWSAQVLLIQPSLITKTHLDYFHAGANVAITASYQASVPGLLKHLNISEAEAKKLVKKSVELANEARNEFYSSASSKDPGDGKRQDLFIAGSVGPYGAFLADGSEYRGDYVVPKDEMKAFHRGRIEALVQAGVDVLACETIPSVAEVSALAELLGEEFADTQAWFSFTLRDGERISDGTLLADVVKVLEGCGNAVAIGVNCVKEDVALPALEELRKRTSKPLVVYPNSGEDWNAAKRDWEGSRSGGKELADRIKEYWNAGGRLIGGCCRTTPDDIRIIVRALEGGGQALEKS